MNTTLAEATHEIRLDNGLRILVLRRDFAPTFAGYYHFEVGSAHDPVGSSGIAHLLEHMMFKGTERIGVVRANEYSELVTRAGGHGMNATTSYDCTRYFVQLPANQLEFYFELEAQRLREPVFREFEAERDVVLEERRLRVENSAEGLSFEKHRELMYPRHPYGVPVIGWPRDIRELRESDAIDYFRTWYSPSNCKMVLVGDVDPESVARLAEDHLGPWARQQLEERAPRPAEPPESARLLEVDFDAEPHLRMGWITVPETHEDDPALQLLSQVLGEMTSSRLNRVLVHERGLASALISFAFGQVESGSFNLIVRPRGDASLESVEQAVLEEVDRVAREGVEAEELERARTVLEASRVKRLSSNLHLAGDLGDAVLATGDPSWLDQQGERLAAVQPEQLREAARRWLHPDRRCVVGLRRSGEGAGAGGGNGAGSPGESTEHPRQGIPSRRDAPHSDGFSEMLRLIEGAPTVDFEPPRVGREVRRSVLAAGSTLFLRESHELPALTLNAHFTGGSYAAPLESLASYGLAGAIWSEGGAGEWDPIALERRKEDLGLRVEMRPGTNGWSLSLWTLSRHLDEALELLIAMLRQPRIDAGRLEVLTARQIELMRRRADYPSWGIAFLAQKVLHGDHPRLGYQPSRAELEALGPEDMAEAFARNLGAGNLYLTAVGDLEIDELSSKLEMGFEGWRPASHPERDWLPRDPSIARGVHVLEKEIAQPAVRILQECAVDRTASDEEHAALEILNRLLGGSGFRSRLMERLRTDEGLTYGVNSSWMHEGRPGVPSVMSISFQTRASAVARAIAIVEEECRRLREELPSEEEVREQIQAWRNSFLFRFENEAHAVTRIMHHELDDRDHDRDRQVLARVERVEPAQVREAARRWLRPEDFSCCVFGSPSPEAREELGRERELRIWERDLVLGGGY